VVAELEKAIVACRFDRWWAEGTSCLLGRQDGKQNLLFGGHRR